MPQKTEKMLVNRVQFEQMKRDHADMARACQTRFRRCACGRLAEVGIICPTNQEGGECEAGS